MEISPVSFNLLQECRAGWTYMPFALFLEYGKLTVGIIGLVCGAFFAPIIRAVVRKNKSSMRKSVSKKRKFIFWRRIFSGVFFAALFFLSVCVASAQTTHTDVFTCTPSGSIPANAVPCPNAETPLVRGPYVCAIGTANPYCPAVNFTYCDDRKLVASCSGATASGEYVCQAGYGLVGGVCCKPDCSCAANTCIGSTCSDGCGGTCAGTKDCGQWCGRCSTITTTTYVTWYDRNGGCDDDWFNQRSESLCDTRCYTPNNCAASTCIDLTCWDGCKFINGEIVPDCSCDAYTCKGSTCPDGCGGICPGKFPTTPGSCGPASRLYSAYEENWDGNLCAPGSPNPPFPVFPLPRSSTSWTCSGICGGSSSPTCSATREAQSFWREVAP